MIKSDCYQLIHSLFFYLSLLTCFKKLIMHESTGGKRAEALVDGDDVKQLVSTEGRLMYGAEYLVAFFRMWRRETG